MKDIDGELEEIYYYLIEQSRSVDDNRPFPLGDIVPLALLTTVDI